MLANMCGWNEPENVNVQSIEVKVDAALIELLRAAYAELRIRQACGQRSRPWRRQWAPWGMELTTPTRWARQFGHYLWIVSWSQVCWPQVHLYASLKRLLPTSVTV